MQGQPGLPRELVECHRKQCVRAGRFTFQIRPIVRCVPGPAGTPGHYESFRLCDLAIDALVPILLAIRTTHAQAVGTAGPIVIRNDSSCETTWTEPSDQMLGIGPGSEDQLARRIENAHDNEHAIDRFHDRATSRGHLPLLISYSHKWSAERSANRR